MKTNSRESEGLPSDRRSRCRTREHLYMTRRLTRYVVKSPAHLYIPSTSHARARTRPCPPDCSESSGASMLWRKPVRHQSGHVCIVRFKSLRCQVVCDGASSALSWHVRALIQLNFFSRNKKSRRLARVRDPASARVLDCAFMLSCSQRNTDIASG